MPVLGLTNVANATCVYPGQEAAVAAAQQAATSSPVVTVIEACGGDDTSYQIPLSVDVTFDGRVFENVYVTTNSVITFGRPDGTYWDYPSTPSISLYSMDWVIYPQARQDEHLIISSSEGGFQVNISARPIWQQQATEPTNIIITAAILSDGTVAMAYSLDGPTYDGSTRTGVRLNDGTVVNFETYGIDQVTESPELSPEPTTESPFVPEPTQSPTVSPEPTESPTVSPEPTESPTTSPEPTQSPEPEPTPFLNVPMNVVATQLQDGSVEIAWDAPASTSTAIERYAIGWSTDNFQNNGWGWTHDQTSVVIPRDILAQYGGLGNTFQFRIRADNDTASVYSNYSNVASLFISYPPPVIPDDATVYSEGQVAEIIAPQGQRISTILGYYGDPNDSRNGLDITPVLSQFIGSQSATIQANNEMFTDPAGGIVKIMILLVTFEDVVSESPVVEPTVSPTASPQPEPSPEPVQPPILPQPVEPSPEPYPEPPIVLPTPTPTPVEPDPTISPEPTPSPTETPLPTPIPEPTEEPAPEPTPSPEPTVDPEPEPTKEPEPEVSEKPEPSPSPEPPKEPEPIVPEKVEIEAEIVAENIEALVEELSEIQPQLLTEEQQTLIVAAALEVFQDAEQGSAEYEAALDALLVVAQADDIVLNEELAAIPLIGNVAGAAVEVFNALGNAGADMSPQVREQSEKVVIAAVIVGQVAMTATAAATSAAAAAARRP